MQAKAQCREAGKHHNNNNNNMPAKTTEYLGGGDTRIIDLFIEIWMCQCHTAYSAPRHCFYFKKLSTRDKRKCSYFAAWSALFSVDHLHIASSSYRFEAIPATLRRHAAVLHELMLASLLVAALILASQAASALPQKAVPLRHRASVRELDAAESSMSRRRLDGAMPVLATRHDVQRELRR
eukprot:17458-Heterococcus_DN1.PRE.3